MNQTIQEFSSLVLDEKITRFEAMWGFITYLKKPLIAFLIGFVVGYFVVALFGAMAMAGKKKFNQSIFVLATAVGFLTGLGALAISVYVMMNGI